MYKQGDIYWVNLNPAKGRETRKNRPCVIIQFTILNDHSATLIVAPILPGFKSWPFVVNVTPSTVNGIDKERDINLKQLRVVDISRIGDKQGIIEPHYIDDIKERLSLIFDLH